jgi:ESAT-6 family protein
MEVTMGAADPGHEIVVDFAAFAGAGDHIRTAIEAMHQQLSAVERAAEPLVATWQGEAKQAYLTRQAAWRRAAQDLTAVLQQIHRGVEETALDFAETERRNARRFE